ncbi:MAG: extracellular solute-binding protein [Saccharospirillaceae bacterium]|nr:extracellular solute-binding protein [Pseudomonadales bacterium]NRB78855.1 extracellular solute-binding protein [Saccharospirillaceae bacterium]
MKPIQLFIVLMAVFSSALFSCSTKDQDDTLVVYSARNEQLLTPIFAAYTEKTGKKFELITDKPSPLLERLKSEGSATQADILFTVDGGNLWHASESGILKELDSDVLEAAIPAQYRSSKNDWFGFSLRARTIFYNKDLVDPSELSTYANLSDARWNDVLCLRTSKKVYNQSLVATMIANLGEEEAQTTVKGWVDNLATTVFSNDTKMLNAINSGICEVGIANTYYYGRIVKKDPEFNVGIFFANQKTSGTHVNVSGAGVIKHSKNPKAAQEFLEWLSQGDAQKLFAELNQEYPANPSIAASAEVQAWGDFIADELSIEKAGQLQTKSVMLMDNAGYQ